jgi:phosphoglucomutase
MTDSDVEYKLEQIAQAPNGGAQAAQNLREWLDDRKPMVDTAEVLTFTRLAPTDLLIDSFRTTIPFGTGGRRGRVGIGPNRINLRIVALTAAGHAEYLRKTAAGRNLRIVVANDTRVFTDINRRHQFMGDDWPLLGVSSRSLALFACKVYAVYGIESYITSPHNSRAFMPTPELSFAIRELGADGGLNVSASHNHPDDNGLKVYNPQGGQYFPPADEDLARFVQEVELPDYLEAEIGKIREAPTPLPGAVHATYIDMYVQMNARMCKVALPDNAPIVYTPLCGTGLDSVGQVLRQTGHDFSVPPNQYPDGSFAAIPMRSPNPEILGVAEPAISYASSIGAELVLSTDPDADRLGVEVKLPDGTWEHFTGNKIAAVLAYYLIADEAGPKLPGNIITTVATSRILRAIAELGDDVETVDDLMIGFKFIGQYLDSAEAGGNSKHRLILAAEESHGYLTTDRIRDKDAASGAFLIAYLHQTLHRRGETLWDYLMKVYQETGIHIEFGRSLVFPGAQGAASIETMMRSLRQEMPTTLGGETVLTAKDYLLAKPVGASTEGERAAYNIIEVASEHYRAVIRPSGTEAKLKYYFDYREAPSETYSTADRYRIMEPVVWTACKALYSDLATRAGYRLSESALELPDVISVPDKINTTQG